MCRATLKLKRRETIPREEEVSASGMYVDIARDISLRIRYFREITPLDSPAMGARVHEVVHGFCCVIIKLATAYRAPFLLAHLFPSLVFDPKQNKSGGRKTGRDK